jgi:hypothetical protein
LKNIQISNQAIIEGRQQHSACIIGKYMIVCGGINTQKLYLSDMKYLDLKALEWQTKEYKVNDMDLCEFLAGGIAKHTVFTHFK